MWSMGEEKKFFGWITKKKNFKRDKGKQWRSKGYNKRGKWDSKVKIKGRKSRWKPEEWRRIEEGWKKTRGRRCQSERSTCVSLSIIYRTRPPVGGYPRNHYAPLCFQPLKIHPVSWLMSGASSWTASAGGARCFFDLMTRCPTQAWQRTRALCLYLSSLCSSSRISVSIPFRSPLPTIVWINRERNFWRTRWRANNKQLIKLIKNYFCLKIKLIYIYM